MKILFCWDTAGVFATVAKWLNDNGHEARIVMNEECDPFGHSDSSGCAVMVKGPKAYYLEIIKQMREFKPDVVHVSDNVESVVLTRLFAPRTPIFLTYHGPVRRREKIHPESKLVEKITVAIPDLSNYGEWMDRPIRDMFYYRGGRVPSTALMVYADYWWVDWRDVAKIWAQRNGMELTILDRAKGDMVPYMEMPEYLSQFDYYLDWKGHKYNEDGSITFSLMALEAAACGCKIIHDSNFGKIYEELEVIKSEDYLKIYSTMKRRSIRRALWQYPRAILGVIKKIFGRLDVDYEKVKS